MKRLLLVSHLLCIYDGLDVILFTHTLMHGSSSKIYCILGESDCRNVKGFKGYMAIFPTSEIKEAHGFVYIIYIFYHF